MKPKAILDDWQPNLILGIEQEKTVTPIGFGTRSFKPSARSTSKPILYDDDAPICTVAPTRSGKGRGVIIPNLLRYSEKLFSWVKLGIRDSELAAGRGADGNDTKSSQLATTGRKPASPDDRAHSDLG